MADAVVLGLSGGVDSALAARLLREAGYAVRCLYLDNGVGDPDDARAVAERLGLPLEVRSVAGALERFVCAPFARGYLSGKTPSPCALCNPTVKFPALLAYADEIGARLVATGHYARADRGRLRKGMAPNDQSYLLARLTREQLQRVIFPLGDYNKATVRQLAEGAGLPVAHKRDSMEICFIPDDDYPGWLARRGPVPPPGNFVDRDGKVLGRHLGYHRYTIGQGRGLGVPGPHKYYVSAIRPQTNEVVLSDGGDLFTCTVRCGEVNWLAFDPADGPRRVTARFRHSRDETPATITLRPDGALLAETDAPVRAPTPGQLAVFYDGDTAAASGWIE